MTLLDGYGTAPGREPGAVPPPRLALQHNPARRPIRQRWRERLPELEALHITAGTVDAACAWLAEHGAAGYLETGGLRVIAGPAHAPTAFSVPFGWCLARDSDGTWACVSTEFLRRRYDLIDPGPAGTHAWR